MVKLFNQYNTTVKSTYVCINYLFAVESNTLTYVVDDLTCRFVHGLEYFISSKGNFQLY